MNLLRDLDGCSKPVDLIPHFSASMRDNTAILPNVLRADPLSMDSSIRTPLACSIVSSTANARAPHWADPLKGWGDVLLREGRTADALVKYDESLKYAPAWAELHQVRNTVARSES